MDWSAVVKEQEQSGLGVREFCVQRGLKEGKFYMGRSVLRKSAEQIGKFARVETTHRVSLELESGVVIRVLISDLREVLSALK